MRDNENSMQKHGYKNLAHIYDTVNQKKNYAAEVDFLTALLKKHAVTTVLDVGCGTGTHMHLLEQAGFACNGIDLNQEMLDIASTKVAGHVSCKDMTDFSLGKTYDALICMFAVFNHILETAHAQKTLSCFQQHLNPGGIVLIDLHNPQTSGKKENTFGTVTHMMKWHYDPKTRIEKSEVTFSVDGKKYNDHHTMRIYTVDEMHSMMEQAGFSKITAYEDYGFTPANVMSKNLEIFAKYF